MSPAEKPPVVVASEEPRWQGLHWAKALEMRRGLLEAAGCRVAVAGAAQMTRTLPTGELVTERPMGAAPTRRIEVGSCCRSGPVNTRSQEPAKNQIPNANPV